MSYQTTTFLKLSCDFMLRPVGYGISLLLLVVFPIVPLHGQSIDMEELKNRFFSNLSQSQIISLMETLDRNQQLTTAELGAKYKWGYIPPDRTPPVTLAQWWDRQNSRQRRQHRIEWFREHYLELNVKRSAEELGLKDRYTRLYRKLQVEENSSAPHFEQVTFPATDEEETRPSESAESSQPDRDRTTPGRQRGDQQTEDTTEATTKTSPAPASETQPPSQEADTSSRQPIWQKEVEIGGRKIIYERVGDDIRVVRGSSDYSHLESEPDYEFPFQDERPTVPVKDLPALRTNDDLPLPGLRFYRSGENQDPPDGLRLNQ